MREPRKKGSQEMGIRPPTMPGLSIPTPRYGMGLEESHPSVYRRRGKCGIAPKTEHERVCCKPGGSSWESWNVQSFRTEEMRSKKEWASRNFNGTQGYIFSEGEEYKRR